MQFYFCDKLFSAELIIRVLRMTLDLLLIPKFYKVRCWSPTGVYARVVIVVGSYTVVNVICTDQC